MTTIVRSAKISSCAVGRPSGFQPPSWAVAAGYTNLVFFDDFTSTATIDMSNSLAPGFNWYIKRAWPLMATSGWTTTTPPIGTYPDFLTSNLSVSSSVLSLLSDQSGDKLGLCLQTCAATGTGSTFVGKTFSIANGFAIVFYFRYDKSLNNTVSTWPAMWMTDINSLTGGSFSFFTEVDLFEHGGPTNFNVHDWSAAGGSIDGANNAVNSTDLGNMVFNQIGTLITPMAKNAGTGQIRRYINNVLQSGNNIDYSATGISSSSQAGRTGAFSALDAQQNMLILSCGNAWPNYIDYVAVFTG